MNVQCSGGSKNFAKETRASDTRNIVAGHRKVTMTNWEQSLKLISYNYMRSCRRTKRWLFYGCLAFEANQKGEKAKWVPYELTTNKKRIEVLSSPTLCHHNEPFLNWIVMCDEKWISQDNGDNQLSDWTEKKLQSTSQSQTCIKKRLWSLFGGLLLVWPTAAFWIPVKPLQLRRRLSKSVRITKNCNACSWSTEWAQFFSMTMLNCTSQKQCFKSWTNWATKFCLIHLSSYQPTTSTTFCRQKLSTTSRRQKMLSKNWMNFEAPIFMLQE